MYPMLKEIRKKVIKYLLSKNLNLETTPQRQVYGRALSDWHTWVLALMSCHE